MFRIRLGEGNLWGPQFRHLIFPYLAPILLTIVACLQIILVNTSDLSPWKGGGFGMFSTVDAPSARYLKILINTEDGEIPVPVPSQMRYQAKEARVIPSCSRLVKFAQRLSQGTWVRHKIRKSGEPTYVTKMVNEGDEDPDAAEKPVYVDRIRVEVWRYRFNSETLQLQAELISLATYDKAGYPICSQRS